MNGASICPWMLGLALLSLAPRAPMQQPPGAPGSQGGMNPAASTQDPWSAPPPTTAPQYPGVLAPVGDPANSVWALPRAPGAFAGWPSFPSQLSGYGSYPAAAPGADGAAVDAPELAALLPFLLGSAKAVPPAAGWPGWSLPKGRAGLPYAPDLGLLVRHSDRVWLQAGPGEPFVPLPFHDKLQLVRAGAGVEVRRIGEFEVLLHDSTRLFARGPTAVRIDELAASTVRIDLRGFTWLRVGAVGRAHAIALPDGSTLRIAGGAPAEGAPAYRPSPSPVTWPQRGVADLLLQRADEPGSYRGRATMTNLGAVPVVWHHAGGETVLDQGHRVAFFLEPPGPRIGDALELVACSEESQGARTVCRSPGGGTAAWSGARFSVPAGGTVVFERLPAVLQVP